MGKLIGVLGLFSVAAGSTSCIHVKFSDSDERPFDHFATRMVGSGHIGLNVRADYRDHLALAAKEMGAKYVRGHGLFNNDMHISRSAGVNSW